MELKNKIIMNAHLRRLEAKAKEDVLHAGMLDITQVTQIAHHDDKLQSEICTLKLR